MEIDRIRVPWKVLAHEDGSVAEHLSRAVDTFKNNLSLPTEREKFAQHWNETRRNFVRSRTEQYFPQVFQTPPDRHEQPALVHSNKLRFTLGLSQAAQLCKTQIINAIPSPDYKQFIDSLAANKQLQGLRGKVEEAVLSAHVWNTEETKLPRRYRDNQKQPSWKFNVEYGNHPDQRSRRLSQSLFKLVDLN
ncbi:39S ribosomal protein L37, mitochondrial, partial [Cichlidogyrus casuarinus]